MVNEFLDEIKKDILILLNDAPLTSYDIQNKLQASYQSIRRCIVQLEQEGKVRKFDRKARNARYTLGAGIGPKSIIPYVRFEGKDFKLTDLTDFEGLETICQQAGADVMKAWTAIAMTAQRLASGVPDETLTKRLNAQRHSLGLARNRLEHINFLINQMLDNPKLWDTGYLIQFIDDKDWGEFLPHLDKLYANYYGAGNNNEG